MFCQLSVVTTTSDVSKIHSVHFYTASGAAADVGPRDDPVL